MQKDFDDNDYSDFYDHPDPLPEKGAGAQEELEEGDRVVIDKDSISEQFGTIRFFFGNGYAEVYTDEGDSIPVHIFRINKI